MSIDEGSHVHVQTFNLLDETLTWRITITVPFRQLDLLECSCELLHLATWSKRHHIRGITCRGEEGRVTSVHTLGQLCSLKQNNNPGMYPVLGGRVLSLADRYY